MEEKEIRLSRKCMFEECGRCGRVSGARGGCFHGRYRGDSASGFGKLVNAFGTLGHSLEGRGCYFGGRNFRGEKGSWWGRIADNSCTVRPRDCVPLQLWMVLTRTSSQRRKPGYGISWGWLKGSLMEMHGLKSRALLLLPVPHSLVVTVSVLKTDSRILRTHVRLLEALHAAWKKRD